MVRDSKHSDLHYAKEFAPKETLPGFVMFDLDARKSARLTKEPPSETIF
jgi:hypothetical protein